MPPSRHLTLSGDSDALANVLLAHVLERRVVRRRTIPLDMLMRYHEETTPRQTLVQCNTDQLGGGTVEAQNARTAESVQ